MRGDRAALHLAPLGLVGSDICGGLDRSPLGGSAHHEVLCATPLLLYN